MAPAAFHRIAFAGENTEEFFRIGSRLVMVSALPLALGISGDLFVAASLALSSPLVGLAASISGLAVLSWLWFARPLILRWQG